MKNTLIYFHNKHGMKWFYLSVIVLIAFLLRVLYLDKIPPGLYADEASIGYNAYCISETGRDEHGEILPVYFKAFGEYKNPVLIYFAALLIKLFGPTVFTLRLAPAISGILAVFFTYKLAELYFDKLVSLLSAFLLAVSPWHILFSREVGDASSLTVFLLAGFYLFSLGLKTENRYIIFSSIPIGLSFYCYGIAKIFVPLFYFFLILTNYKKVLEKKRTMIICFLLVGLILIPMVKTSLEKDIQGRFNMLSIANNTFSLDPKEKELKNSNLSFLTKHKSTLIATIFIQNYFKHMSLDFLLKNGDRNIRHHTESRGQLLWFTFWMAIVGFFYLILKKQKELYIFPVWFLLFPVPASLTWESLPHAPRTICGLPVFEILAAVGFTLLFSFAKDLSKMNYKNAKILLYSLLLLIVLKGIIDLKVHLKSYFINYAKNYWYGFDYDVYAISKATENMKDYDAFVMPMDFPLVNILYLQKIDPKKWLADKSVLKYVRKFPLNYYNSGKKIARIVRLGSYSDEETVNRIYNEFTGEIIFEVKRVKTPMCF